MLIYAAICITYDPETDNSGEETETLGLFSELKYAQNAFDRQERRESKFFVGRPYIHKHTCFRGKHEVREYELDVWQAGMRAYWLFGNNKWTGYRIRE